MRAEVWLVVSGWRMLSLLEEKAGISAFMFIAAAL